MKIFMKGPKYSGNCLCLVNNQAEPCLDPKKEGGKVAITVTL